ncbi:MAG: ABC transporter permease [Fuerstiella sp.]|nr:ABC transporter permease [Fuerstiella sp.]
MNVFPLLAQSTTASDVNWVPAWLIALGFLFALIGFGYWTRAGVIARATTKEAVRQPLFFLLLIISGFVLLVNTFIPFFTLEADVKMLKECGLATLLISGLMLTVWTAGTSITNEIEGKTAMTLLSKPINRRQFVLGKYIGIMQSALWLLVPLAIIFGALIFYKVGHDQREMSETVSPWFEDAQVAGFTIKLPQSERMAVVTQVIPGVVLVFFEVAVLGAISVAVATRLPIVVNLVVCFAIFVIGNLTPMMVSQSELVIRNEAVTFVARLIATAVPSLDAFNVSAAVATETQVLPSYTGMALIYCVAYVTATILFAFILFEDRDLA